MKSKSLISFFSFCALLLTAVSFAQQTATIKGKITHATAENADNVSVILKGTQIGTITNASGEYEIKNLKPGNYTLRISEVGYSSKEKNVLVTAGDEVVENFTISSTTEELSEVSINGAKTNSFARKESTIVSKMPLKDIENPQVYNTISSELLKDQVVTSLNDALKNAPGLDRLWESTGRGGDGAGYFSLRGFAVQPTMVNGLPALSNGSADPANIERIEVIKGPSGTLFGSSLISYGGLINVTTKKPYETFGGSISYIGGTYGLNRVTADINTPLGTANKAAVRINAAYHNENSFQDAGFKKSFFFAPSLSYKVNEKLSFNINTEFYNGRSTNQTMIFLDRGAPLRANNMRELGYDNKRSYTSNDLYMDTPTYNLQGQMTYKISDKWTSQTAISRTSAKSDGYYSYLYEGTGSIEFLVQQTNPSFTIPGGIILARSTSKQNAETTGLDIQQNFIGNFNIGNFKNKFIGGLDYFNLNNVSNSTGYGNQGFVNLGVDATLFASLAPALHAYYGTPINNFGHPDDTGVLTQDAADAGIAALGAPTGPSAQFSKTKQEVFSAYASNVIYFMPNLSAMVSLRIDRFSNKGDLSTNIDDYNQTAFSPKFGVVYQPIQDKVAVFANYLNGFSNVAPITTPDNNIFVFDPEQANQFEFGTKINLLGDKLIAAASYYNTKVSNTVLQLGPNDYIQDGEQTNKGFEASITASPIEGLNIIAGYSYNDSVLESTSPGNEFAGRRPESAGPQNLANLWASYKFTFGKLQGFGLGFGGNYSSKNEIFNRTVGTFTLPDYTILNASVSYSVSEFQIILKADNLTDKEYYKGWSTINPQRPRVFSIGATYNF